MHAQTLIAAAQDIRQALAESDGDVSRALLAPLMRALREAESAAQPVESPAPPAVTTRYSEKEAARLLGVSWRTLQERRLKGELKEGVHYSTLAARISYTPTHLNRIAEGQRAAKDGLRLAS